MNNDHLEESMPKLYGIVTIGERGQVVIPAQARKELGLEPSDKLIVFGSPHEDGSIILTRAESVTEIMAKAMSYLAQVEEMLQINTVHPGSAGQS